MQDHEVIELEEAVEQIWEVASAFGLEPFPTRFEIVPTTIMYEIGSYALPGRYSHWTFGKAYHKMKTMYDFGLSKIYEVVINSNPAYAFLLESNSLLQNKMVIAHVLGHADFFKHNAYFSRTNRRMVDSASAHATRIYNYEFQYGRKVVEDFLDAVLSIEEHIDSDLFIKREHEDQDEALPLTARPGRYDDLLSAEERRAAAAPSPDGPGTRKPRAPEKDILLFLMKHSPALEPWQCDIIAMVRDEMEYFLPQMQTKIMNEGWASYWHSRIMRELDLPDDEFVQFAEMHSGVVSPHKGSLNPYYLGYKIFEDIERRWDLPSDEERRVFGRQGNEGRQKILEVREMDNDISFLRNYLTKELCEELDLFVYQSNETGEWTITEKSWEKVRDTLVSSMTHFGLPLVEITDDDYNRNRELFITHRHEGVDLDTDHAKKVLEYLYTLWGRTVHLSTVLDGDPLVLHFDGSGHTED